MTGEKTEEKQIVIEIRRVTKVTKGGKNLSFRAIVVVGNGQGKGGFGVGKANEVPEAIRKAVEQARKNMIEIPLKDGTIPHDVKSKFGPSIVILKPASKGHGMVAGRTMRALFDVCGIKDITCKCLGSTNPINVLYATTKALSKIKVRREENED
ncbi:MAG: 30S ribosomal protein S5 [Candidatus Omnitrophica bacterium]|nr:30S ribosomal protein S5 [Candidatus Omnitrophota bacterium]MCM8809936.1 30S ribosomal protein S5 [Candidatus Omnitrophota bacterium]MCM8810667.1 30S ribosomal protein S5 [Candidatus Omnitrophota bacterium]